MKNKIYRFINKTKSIYNFIFYFLFKRLTRADFSGDGLICLQKTLGFTKKNSFSAIIERNHETNEDKSRIYRIHTLWWAAQIGLSIDGDFVECGVYRGFFSKVLCDLIQFEKIDKTFWLYDSFCGFSPKYTSANDFSHGKLFLNIAKSEYEQEDHYAYVKKRFQRYDNVKIIKGFLPDSLEKDCSSRIAYLHIDLNSPAAELLTLEKIYPRVSKGAPIIFDDYGWKNFRKQHEVIDKFMQNRDEKILELPTGQGLVIKNR